MSASIGDSSVHLLGNKATHAVAHISNCFAEQFQSFLHCWTNIWGGGFFPKERDWKRTGFKRVKLSNCVRRFLCLDLWSARKWTKPIGDQVFIQYGQRNRTFFIRGFQPAEYSTASFQEHDIRSRSSATIMLYWGRALEVNPSKLSELWHGWACCSE